LDTLQGDQPVVELSYLTLRPSSLRRSGRAGIYANLDPAALSDEELLELLQSLARLRLGDVVKACCTVFKALQASETMRAKLSADDGWQLLMPLAEQLAGHADTLQPFEHWLGNTSSTDNGPDVGILGVHLPFALLLALSKTATAAHSAGESAVMQTNDSAELPAPSITASVPSKLAAKLTRRLAQALQADLRVVSQASLRSMSQQAMQHMQRELCLHGSLEEPANNTGMQTRQPGPAESALQTILHALTDNRTVLAATLGCVHPFWDGSVPQKEWALLGMPILHSGQAALRCIMRQLQPAQTTTRASTTLTWSFGDQQLSVSMQHCL
jgi:hypothetical protein